MYVTFIESYYVPSSLKRILHILAFNPRKNNCHGNYEPDFTDHSTEAKQNKNVHQVKNARKGQTQNSNSYSDFSLYFSSYVRGAYWSNTDW